MQTVDPDDTSVHAQVTQPHCRTLDTTRLLYIHTVMAADWFIDFGASFEKLHESDHNA